MTLMTVMLVAMVLMALGSMVMMLVSILPMAMRLIAMLFIHSPPCWSWPAAWIAIMVMSLTVMSLMGMSNV